ncbi:MAG: hypothetical protein U5L45_03965 [Saprospiraceae bacterium]|nr:hypothetical protein [Saprospiraceae bacterium]
MSLSLFFAYANTKKDKAHYQTLSKTINPFVKSKGGSLLDCENEDCLLEHADNADVLIVLLSTDYLDYDNDVLRKDMHVKIKHHLHNKTKLVIPIELEACFWMFDAAFEGRQPHKLEQQDATGYMKLVHKIITEISDQKPKINFKDNLNKGLFSLNYDEQRQAFDTHFKELSFLNILLMRGSNECGQYLLLKTFLNSQKIDFKDERKLIWLNAKNFAFDQSESWIWEQIADKFSISPPQNVDIKKIGKYIIERLQTEPIFIRFDDIHLVKKESLEVVRKMWEQLYDYISTCGVGVKNQIFLFVTDRSGGDNEYSKAQFSSSHNSAICEKVFCILPKIKFLKQDDAAEWLKWLGKDPDLKTISQNIQKNHIVPNENQDISIRKAVSNMIDVLGEIDEDLKNDKSNFLDRI